MSPFFLLRAAPVRVLQLVSLFALCAPVFWFFCFGRSCRSCFLFFWLA